MSESKRKRRNGRLKGKQIERSGGHATRDRTRSRVLKNTDGGQVSFRHKRKPTRRGIKQERTAEGFVETGHGLLRRTPGGRGDRFKSFEPRKKFGTKGGRVRGKGESTIKDNPKKSRSGVKEKRHASKRKRRLYMRLARVHREERNLALGRVKREQPLLGPPVDDV